MGAAVPLLGGALLGGIAGVAGQNRQGGQDTGNIFMGGDSRGVSEAQGRIQNAMGGLAAYSPEQAQSGIQNSELYSPLFGKQGALNQAIGQYQDLSKTGFQLQPEDLTAYGQVSGDIARQFGQSDQSLAQAMADRGLSSSGVAASQFAGSLGNKQEQLAQLQTQIAQNRMNMNLQRMGQLQNFIQGLGSQEQSAVNQKWGEEMQKNQMQYNQGIGFLGNIQNQNNEALQQRQQTSRPSDLSAGFSGAIGGLGMANSMMGSGGMFGSSKMPTQPSTNVKGP